MEYNKFLNNKVMYSQLEDKFRALIPHENQKNHKSASLVLSRLCSRLPEEIMIFVTQEMAKNKSPTVSVESCLNEEQFYSHVSSLIRSYFTQAVQTHSDLWRIRSSCIRARCIVAIDEFSAHPTEIVKKLIGCQRT